LFDARISGLSGEISTRLGETHRQLAEQMASAIESRLSTVNPHLDQLIHTTFQHIHRQLDQRLTELVHSSLGHINHQLDERLSGLGTELGKQVAEMHRQLAQQTATEIHNNVAHVDRHLTGLIIDARGQLARRDGTADPGTLFIDDQIAEDRIRRIGECLQMEAVRSHNLVRVGGDADGGYLLVDDFGRVETAFSFGVGDEFSWDLDMAGRGITVHQFDHTIDSGPVDHARVHFHRIQVAPFAAEGAESLSSALRFCETDAPVIVKMDIEGDEWSVLEQLADADADRIAQLVCEFHNFDQIVRSPDVERAVGVLSKLRDKFGVVHLHANNYGKVIVLGTITFPEILEVSFANRKLYDLVPADVRLPIPLDRPNRKDIAEIALGRFRY
jgi:hypothetical protein